MAGSNSGDGSSQRGPRGTLVMAARSFGAPVPEPGVGDHWPIPQDVLGGLPQLPVTQSLEPRGAAVPFQGQGSAVDWLRYSGAVHWRDKDAERRKRNLTTWAVVLLVIGIPALLLFGLGLVPIGISIYLFVQKKKYDQVDIEDRRLEVFTGTLTAFASELKRRRPVSVALDFTAYTAHGTRAATGTQGFLQRWLTLELPLRDGSTVGVDVSLRVKEKSRRKNSYTKVKSQQVELIRVRLTPPSGKAFAPRTELGRHQGRAVAGLGLRHVAVGPRQAVFAWATHPSLRSSGRGGWSTQGAARIDSRQLTAAIIASYRLAAQEARHGA
jgi:hypothetical protein